MDVSYGGQSFGFVRTRKWDFKPEYEGPDYLFTRARLCLSSVLSRVGPSPNSGGPEYDLVNLEEKLRAPRRELVITLGGRRWFDIAPPDPANGPFPRMLSVTEVQGSASLLIDWEVEWAFRTDCPGGTQQPQWLSHRWEESVSIDENFYSAWQRTGLIITRSDMTVDPDALRGVVVPPLTPGFVRLASDYTVLSSGLGLRYAYRDQERYLLPPPPATKARGRYVESSQSGAVCHGECRVELEAPKTVAKADLLAVAISVAMQRIQQAGGAFKAKDGKFLAASVLAEELWENKVEVSIKTRLAKKKARFKDLTHDLEAWGQPPLGSEPGVTEPADPGTRGTAGLVLIAAALNDPCLTQVVVKAGGVADGDSSDLQGVPEATVSLKTGTADDLEAKVKESGQEEGFYPDYTIDKADVSDEGTDVMGVTVDGADPVVVALVNPTTRRVVDWTAERTGKAPEIPDPDTKDDNLVLLSKEIHREDPDLEADGETLTYKASGRYIYGIKKPSKAATLKASGGIPPWMDPSVSADEATNDLDYQQGIIDFDAGGSTTLSSGGPGGGPPGDIGPP